MGALVVLLISVVITSWIVWMAARDTDADDEDD
jgi:hypothetical protein